MKKYRIVPTIENKNGNTIFNLASTEASDDWLRYGRLKKLAEEGDETAKQECERMNDSQMIQEVDDCETSMTIEEVQKFLESHSWTFAKTMPESPHWYVHKKDIDDHNTFLTEVRFIQQNGLPGIFDGVTYIYLHLDKFKYWTMGSIPEETTIINRALI